jgi:hypothetical protein
MARDAVAARTKLKIPAGALSAAEFGCSSEKMTREIGQQLEELVRVGTLVERITLLSECWRRFPPLVVRRSADGLSRDIGTLN